MSRIKRGLIAIAIATGMTVVGAVSASAESIVGGGSSFMGTFQATCAAKYSTHTVAYISNASGTGRNQFAVGNYDFGGSEAAYSKTEFSGRDGGFNFAPITAGPIVVGYNLKGVTSLRLDNPTLGGIFSGKITKWNDPEIQKLNKNAKLPDASIVVVYRSSNSGTTDNFSGYLVANVVAPWKRNGVFTSANGTGAPAGSLGFVSNQQVTAAVKGTPNSIGYFDFADARAQGLKNFAAIKNPAGEYVVPSTATATKFLAKNANVQPSGLVGLEWNKKIKGAYNIVAIAYLIGPNGQTDAKSKATEDYAKYLLDTCGPKESSKIGYLPLTGKILALAKTQVEKFSN
jgi:phosphate transport system substrate-binding protein